MSSFLQIEYLPQHGVTLLRVVGSLGHETAPDLGRAITKALFDVGRVLVDLNDTRVEHVSRSLVFVAALDQAGGWPRARLVLYGGQPVLVRALDGLSVTKTVPHVESLPEALARLDLRPPRVRRRVTLEPRPDSVRCARIALDEACAAWEIAAPRVTMVRQVLSELVANAVEHAATICHVVMEFDGTRLWLSVSDYSHDVPQIRPRNLGAARGRGLQLVELLSDQWGVEHLPRTKTIWAVLAPDPHPPPTRRNPEISRSGLRGQSEVGDPRGWSAGSRRASRS